MYKKIDHYLHCSLKKNILDIDLEIILLLLYRAQVKSHISQLLFDTDEQRQGNFGSQPDPVPGVDRNQAFSKSL